MSLNATEIELKVRHHALFAGLSDEDLAIITADARTQAFSKNEYIIDANPPSDIALLFVLKGYAGVLRPNTAHARAVGLLMPGDIVCVSAPRLGNAHYPFNILAASPVHTLFLTKQALKKAVRQNPEILLRVTTELTSHTLKHQLEKEHLMHKTAAQRVACMLLVLSSHMVGTGGIFRFPFGKMLAAELLGMTLSTFSRALLALKSEGVNSLPNNEIGIDDFGVLTRFTCSGCSAYPKNCSGPRLKKTIT